MISREGRNFRVTSSVRQLLHAAILDWKHPNYELCSITSIGYDI